MGLRLLAVFSLTAWSQWSPTGEGGETPATVAHAVFDVRYAVSSTREQHISGLSYGGGSSAPTNASGLGGDDSGTMKIDVIAATADKGLVVDVSYNGKVTKQPPIRVAILGDGRLGFDPKTPIAIRRCTFTAAVARMSSNVNSRWA